MQDRKTRGGARSGAGRPALGKKDVRIRLLPEDHRLLTQLGGSAWIEEALRLAPLVEKRVIDTRRFSDSMKEAFLLGWQEAGEESSGAPLPAEAMPWLGSGLIEVAARTARAMGSECRRRLDAAAHGSPRAAAASRTE